MPGLKPGPLGLTLLLRRLSWPHRGYLPLHGGKLPCGRSRLTHPAGVETCVTGDEAEGSRSFSRTHYRSHKTNSASSPRPAAPNTPSGSLEKTRGRRAKPTRAQAAAGAHVSHNRLIRRDKDQSQIPLVPADVGVSPLEGVLFHKRGPVSRGLSPGKYTPPRRPSLTPL